MIDMKADLSPLNEEQPKGYIAGGAIAGGIGAGIQAITGLGQSIAGIRKGKNIDEPNEALLQRQAIGAQEALAEAETDALFGLTPSQRAQIARQRQQTAASNRAAVAESGGPASASLAALSSMNQQQQNAIGDLEIQDEALRQQKRQRVDQVRQMRDKKLTEQYNVQSQRAAMQRQEANQLKAAGLGNLQGAAQMGANTADTTFRNQMSERALQNAIGGRDVDNAGIAYMFGNRFNTGGGVSPAGSAPLAGTMNNSLLGDYLDNPLYNLIPGLQDGGEVQAYEGGMTAGEEDDPITATTTGNPNKADTHLHGGEIVLDAKISKRIDKALDLANDPDATDAEQVAARKMAGEAAVAAIEFYRQRDEEEESIDQGPHSEAAEALEDQTGQPLSRDKGGQVPQAPWMGDDTGRGEADSAPWLDMDLNQMTPQALVELAAETTPNLYEVLEARGKKLSARQRNALVAYHNKVKQMQKAEGKQDGGQVGEMPEHIEALLESEPMLALQEQGARVRYLDGDDLAVIEMDGYKPMVMKSTGQPGKVTLIHPDGGIMRQPIHRIMDAMVPEKPTQATPAEPEPARQNPVAEVSVSPPPPPQIQPIVIQVPYPPQPEQKEAPRARPTEPEVASAPEPMPTPSRSAEPTPSPGGGSAKPSRKPRPGAYQGKSIDQLLAEA